MSEKCETNGNCIFFLILIYRLKLKVKRLKIALTLDERVKGGFLVVVRDGHRGKFSARHPERNPITHSAVGKLVKKFKGTQYRKCLECGGEHIEHIM
jgi:hypothetical protein